MASRSVGAWAMASMIVAAAGCGGGGPAKQMDPEEFVDWLGEVFGGGGGGGGDDDDTPEEIGDSPLDTTFDNVREAFALYDCTNAACHSSVSAGGLFLGVKPGETEDEATRTLVYQSLMEGGLIEQAGNGEVVDLEVPEASTILTKATGLDRFGNSVPHAGGALWTQADDAYLLVLAWIEAGAPMD